MSAEETHKVIRNRLVGMAEMARLVDSKNINIGELARDSKYIRICGESFRAVSLLDSYPLCGVNKSGSKRLDTILKQLELWKGDSLAPEVLKHKGERRLQCWLIHNALQNKRDLMKPLGLGNEIFDKLLFALDEVSLGDSNHSLENLSGFKSTIDCENEIKIVRSDIIAVGIKNKEVFPVIIELKYDRSRKRLKEQLENFRKLIEIFNEEFKQLLKDCTGHVVNSEPKKILIWPALENTNHVTINELHKEGIGVIEFKGSYQFDSYLV